MLLLCWWSNRCWQLDFSGLSAFSNSSLNIWKFMVHKLLEPDLENFEHYFPSVWHERNCVVIWMFFGMAFGIGVKTDLFQSCGSCWVFQMCWHIEFSTFTAASLRTWNSSIGIPSVPLTLLVVMLPKAHLTLHSRMSGSRRVITLSWLSGSSWSVFIVFLCILPSSP